MNIINVWMVMANVQNGLDLSWVLDANMTITKWVITPILVTNPKDMRQHVSLLKM